MEDKELFDLSDQTIEKLNLYSEDFPINEIDYNLNGKIYTSHEGLLLKYEECFVRKFEEMFFDLSAHFLWIGKLKINNFKVREQII